jgi:hypothetical protein
MRERLTLEAAHDTVEAFRTELVVSKGPKELADDDVGLLRRREATHIREDKLD